MYIHSVNFLVIYIERGYFKKKKKSTRKYKKLHFVVWLHRHHY